MSFFYRLFVSNLRATFKDFIIIQYFDFIQTIDHQNKICRSGAIVALAPLLAGNVYKVGKKQGHIECPFYYLLMCLKTAGKQNTGSGLDLHCFIAPAKREYPDNYFLISPQKHILWVLFRSALARRF